MKLTIVAVRSTVTGQWNYCPLIALPIIGRVLEYDDEPSELLTAEEALSAARADKTIPAGSLFKILQPKPVQTGAGLRDRTAAAVPAETGTTFPIARKI